MSGIHALIREGMNASGPAEISRFVHRYGGTGIGSFHLAGVQSQHGARKVPLPLFMDCTHDNETPNQKRTACDTLPHAAIVGMADCAVGSVKGFDEIVPELLDVVGETRRYQLTDGSEGILKTKKVFMDLHTKMAKEGFHEVNVDQEGDVCVLWLIGSMLRFIGFIR
jgi:glycogen debranching enzyme